MKIEALGSIPRRKRNKQLAGCCNSCDEAGANAVLTPEQQADFAECGCPTSMLQYSQPRVTSTTYKKPGNPLPTATFNVRPPVTNIVTPPIFTPIPVNTPDTTPPTGGLTFTPLTPNKTFTPMNPMLNQSGFDTGLPGVALGRTKPRTKNIRVNIAHTYGNAYALAGISHEYGNAYATPDYNMLPRRVRAKLLAGNCTSCNLTTLGVIDPATAAMAAQAAGKVGNWLSDTLFNCNSKCNILHPFSKTKRTACKTACTTTAAAQQQQQQYLPPAPQQSAGIEKIILPASLALLAIKLLA